MHLITNYEYNRRQYILCKLRADYAYVTMILIDRTEFGKTSFWLKSRDYWERKAQYWKSLGNKAIQEG